MKNCALDTFLHFWDQRCEDDQWDYKKSIPFHSKNERYKLLKDIFAFANFGGGYLLIGIDEKNNFQPTHVTDTIDPADISTLIESATQTKIEIKIRYFTHDFGDDTITVGLIVIWPSDAIVVSNKDLVDEKMKTKLGNNDVYTRRDTRTIKATPHDIEKIMRSKKTTKRAKPVKREVPELTIYDARKRQETIALENVLDDKFEYSAETMAPCIKSIFLSAKQTQKEFAQIQGISVKKLESYFEGQELPPIDFLIRLSKSFDFNVSALFEPTFYGRRAFWKQGLLRNVLLNFISPPARIAQINNINIFLGQVIYETARAVCSLHFYIYGEYIYLSSEDDSQELNGSAKEPLRSSLTRQYYKLLEQVRFEKGSSLTKPEQMVKHWFFCSSTYLVRTFVEAIQSIDVGEDTKPIVTFHFLEEIKQNNVRMRDYDSENLKLVFGDLEDGKPDIAISLGKPLPFDEI